jgi:hypothetical protein
MSLLQNCPTQAASEKSWPLRPSSLGRPGVFARHPRNGSFTLNTWLGQGDGRPRTRHHLIRTVLKTVVFLGDGGGVRQATLQPVVGADNVAPPAGRRSGQDCRLNVPAAGTGQWLPARFSVSTERSTSS